MTTNVRIGVVSRSVVFLPLWASLEAGEFATRGVEPHVAALGTADATTAALVAGEVDVVFGPVDLALKTPTEFTVLAGLADRAPVSLACAPDRGEISLLRGARIGTGSVTEGVVQIIRRILADHGLNDPQHYGFVLAGGQSERFEALKNGLIDAAIQLMPFDYAAESAGFPLLITDELAEADFAFSSACSTVNWRQERPTLSEAVRDALLAAEARIRGDRAWAASVAVKHCGLPVVDAQRCVDRLADGGVMPIGLAHSERAIVATTSLLGGEQDR